jgi:4-amino-4-deoxy-L-arabinose transferase-like glycosyltransferase
MPPRLELPPSRLALLIIALAFALPGLVGHDPWKTYDAVAIEIISQMHRTGDWLIPRLAGEPWLEDPPLYHWTGLIVARLLGQVLPFHGAARLASALYVLTAAWLIYYAARHTVALEERRAAGATAALVLIGSTGLLVHAHEAVPDLASLAGICAALAFAARLADRPLAAGLGLGISLGVAFLAAGPVAPLALGLTLLVTPVACRDWRQRPALVGLATAAAIAALVAASWPAAMLMRAPEQAAQWWSYATQTRGSFADNLRYYLTTASWFAWPAWPLAAWTLWSRRGELRSPRLFVPLAALAVSLAAISLAGPTQDVNTIALLPPLALLAAQGVTRLRRGAASALDWFGVMTFTSFAALVWLGYIAMMSGMPPRIARNFAKTAPGFMPQFEWLPFLLALALLAAWIYLAFGTAPAATRGVTRWAAGAALLWGTVATLWMPWVDHQKSYRSVALQIKASIPDRPGCIARSGVGSAQRAALSYHAGIRTQALTGTNPPRCPLLIVQGSARHERDAPGPRWIKLADAGRPGDKNERLRLYRYRP